jgi:hypothetical protein
MIQPPLSLLAHLVPLRATLRERSNGRPNLNLEVLPYAVCEMWHAITSFVTTSHSVFLRLDSSIPTYPRNLILSDGDRDSLSYSIDLFIDSGRRAQNAVLFYLSSALQMSLPYSLFDLVKKPVTRSGLEWFSPLLQSYWHADGYRLKAYRDLMQHHALVATEAWLARSDSDGALLHLLLPNNPEVKSQAKLIYDSPPIPALPFMEQAFTALIGFVDSVTRLLLSELSGPKIHIIFPNQFAPTAPPTFHPVPSIEELSSRVKQSAEQQRSA